MRRPTKLFRQFEQRGRDADDDQLDDELEHSRDVAALSHGRCRLRVQPVRNVGMADFVDNATTTPCGGGCLTASTTDKLAALSRRSKAEHPLQRLSSPGYECPFHRGTWERKRCFARPAGPPSVMDDTQRPTCAASRLHSHPG
jgi:hypothetical protein